MMTKKIHTHTPLPKDVVAVYFVIIPRLAKDISYDCLVAYFKHVTVTGSYCKQSLNRAAALVSIRSAHR